MKLWIYLIPLLLPACVHHPLKPPVGDGIYPFGTYQHYVRIQILNPPRTMDLRGVVSYQPEHLKVVGLSAFGTTLFRIDESLTTGELKKEFFLEIMQQHPEQFVTFYNLIREIITAPKGTMEFTKQNAHFLLSDPDELGIPRKIHVEHPQFILDVEVTSYDF